MSELAGLIGEAAGLAACEAVEKVRMGELSDMGQVENYIQTAMSSWLDKYGPQFGERLANIAKPATEKAMEVVKPQVEEALKSYMPQFAAIAGGLMGLALIFGVWIAKASQGKPI